MLKRSLLTLLLITFGSIASAQNITGPATACPGVSCIDYNVAGQGSVRITVTGASSFIGTVSFYGSTKAGTFDLLLLANQATGATATGTTTAATYYGPITGVNTIRVKFSLWTSGTANITYRSTTAATVLPSTISPDSFAPVDAAFLVNAANAILTNETVVNLFSGGANLLDNRNGTTAQKFCVYKTYSSAGANYERLCFGEGENATRHTIIGEAAGTGADRTLEIRNSNSILIAAAVATDINFADTNGSSSFRIGVGASAAFKNFQYGSGDELVSVGTPTVANVGANSCGTTAATITGRNVAFKVTVGTVGGTQCRVSFSSAFTTNAPSCTASNESTAALVRTNSTTSRVDLLGVFTAGDVLAGICIGM